MKMKMHQEKDNDPVTMKIVVAIVIMLCVVITNMDYK